MEGNCSYIQKKFSTNYDPPPAPPKKRPSSGVLSPSPSENKGPNRGLHFFTNNEAHSAAILSPSLDNDVIRRSTTFSPKLETSSLPAFHSS